MLLNHEQRELLSDDLDYIIGRTSCNSIQLTRSQILNAFEHDPDILLDLVAGMPPADARWLSVPPDELLPLISLRRHGLAKSGGRHGGSSLNLS